MHLFLIAVAAGVAGILLLLWRHPNRLALACSDDRGEVTEKVIITALFAALALAAATIITIKVTDKAESIPTDTPAQESGGLGE